jgi:hypothetical protein
METKPDRRPLRIHPQAWPLDLMHPTRSYSPTYLQVMHPVFTLGFQAFFRAPSFFADVDMFIAAALLTQNGLNEQASRGTLGVLIRNQGEHCIPATGSDDAVTLDDTCGSVADCCLCEAVADKPLLGIVPSKRSAQSAAVVPPSKTHKR